MQSEFSIRPLRSLDNKPLAVVLREVLIEFGVPKVGTAYADPVLDMMFDAYKRYKKNGFSYVSAPMENTGHYSCPVWMTKSLVFIGFISFWSN